MILATTCLFSLMGFVLGYCAERTDGAIAILVNKKLGITLQIKS